MQKMEIFFIPMRLLRNILFPSKELRLECAETKRKAAANKLLFTPGTELLGKDIRHIVDRAGVYTFFGGMDHGKDIAQWRTPGYVAELHFQDGVCISVEVS